MVYWYVPFLFLRLIPFPTHAYTTYIPSGLDFDDLFHKEIIPPIIPDTRGPGDTSNFEDYPQPTAVVRDCPQNDLFKDFDCVVTLL